LEYDTDICICEDCFKKLRFFPDIPIKPDKSNEKSYCDLVVGVFEYDGLVRDSLRRYKFHNKPSYYRTYSKLLADRLRRMTDIGRYEAVLSVPLHSERERTRGYNQAYLISKALAKELKLPECSYALRRVKYTDAQSLLGRSDRHENVKDAFLVNDNRNITGKSVLLVDDIFTTGATVQECSKALISAGAREVTAAVMAAGKIRNRRGYYA
jgi:ComF family protein